MTGRTLAILDRLIAFDTVSARPNLDCIGWIEAHLTGAGFTVTRLPAPGADKAGLYAEIGPAGAGVLLSGHTDVVPVEGQDWSRDPFHLTVEGGRTYGRGTTDMKGFVASALALAERAAEGPLREPLKIVLSYDEEVGCTGIREMFDRLLPLMGRPRACIVGEPTGMGVATGHKGKVAMKAVCHGQAGHSALAPRFVNALHLATDLVAELRVLQDVFAREGARDAGYDLPYTTLHAGRISGGQALNIVPDRAEVLFEYRHVAADRPGDIGARIAAAAERVAAPYRDRCPAARIEMEELTAYPGLDQDDAAGVVTYAARLSGHGIMGKVAYGTEAGFFQRAGIPTVVCGPGSMEEQGHRPDEYITLDQLAACDAMMDRLLRDLQD